MFENQHSGFLAFRSLKLCTILLDNSLDRFFYLLRNNCILFSLNEQKGLPCVCSNDERTVQIMLQNPHSRLPYRNFRISYCLRGRVQENKCLRAKWTLQTSTRNYSDVLCIWLVNSKLFFCNVHQRNVLFCVQYIQQLYLSPVVTHCLVLASQLSNQHFDFVH